jgi:hypothetical protein
MPLISARLMEAQPVHPTILRSHCDCLEEDEIPAVRGISFAFVWSIPVWVGFVLLLRAVLT